jgi:8-oxo-dGTP diphosphatase
VFDGPTFGSRIAGRNYIVRPGAYALVRRGTNEIAVVQTRLGWYLPGGAIEDGEDAKAAAERETVEECGLVIDASEPFARAIDLVHARDEDVCHEKRCVFLEAKVTGQLAPREPDHWLVWLTLDEARERLTHGSQRWAVEQVTLAGRIRDA